MHTRIDIDIGDQSYCLQFDQQDDVFVCVSSTNIKPDPGETHVRGNDIIDGYANKETMPEILRAWADHIENQ